MTCHHAQHLDAYHDGELPSATARELEAHLARCEACAAELAALRALSARLQAAALPEPTPLMLERWASSRREIEDRRLRRLASWLTSAAAAVLLGTLALSFAAPDAATTTTGSALDEMAWFADDEAPPSLVAAQWIAADLAMAERGGGAP